MNYLLDLFKFRSLKKAQQNFNDPIHPLWRVFIVLPSGRRFIVPRCRTNRFKNSLIPADTNLVNLESYFSHYCCVVWAVYYIPLTRLAAKQISPQEIIKYFELIYYLAGSAVTS